MSLENDIAQIKEMIMLDEGFAQARRDYVDTRKMTMRQLNTLASKDPTYREVGGNIQGGKYIEWMAQLWVNRKEGSRNIDRYDILKEFDSLCNKNKITQKDIKQYDSLNAVADAVHQAEMRMGEESRLKKEQEVRQALIKLNGSTQRAYYHLNGKRLIRGPDGRAQYDAEGHIMIDDTIPEYVTLEFVESIRQRMAKETEGKSWKDFTIDEDILGRIDPSDIAKETPYVYIVEVKSRKKSQYYGKNMWYDPTNSRSKTSFWCTSYTDTYNAWDNYAFYSGEYSTDPEEAAAGKKWQSHSKSRFYIILPKDVTYVPDKLWAKVNVQVTPGDSTHRAVKYVWDTEDARHEANDPAVVKLFKSWEVPWDV